MTALTKSARRGLAALGLTAAFAAGVTLDRELQTDCHALDDETLGPTMALAEAYSRAARSNFYYSHAPETDNATGIFSDSRITQPEQVSDALIHALKNSTQQSLHIGTNIQTAKETTGCGLPKTSNLLSLTQGQITKLHAQIIVWMRTAPERLQHLSPENRPELPPDHPSTPSINPAPAPMPKTYPWLSDDRTFSI